MKSIIEELGLEQKCQECLEPGAPKTRCRCELTDRGRELLDWIRGHSEVVKGRSGQVDGLEINGNRVNEIY